MQQQGSETQRIAENLLATLKRLEGCVNGGHGANAVSMCIDMMQTELDIVLDAHPDIDSSAFEAIVDGAIDVYNRLLAEQEEEPSAAK